MVWIRRYLGTCGWGEPVSFGCDIIEEKNPQGAKAVFHIHGDDIVSIFRRCGFGRAAMRSRRSLFAHLGRMQSFRTLLYVTVALRFISNSLLVFVLKLCAWPLAPRYAEILRNAFLTVEPKVRYPLLTFSLSPSVAGSEYKREHFSRDNKGLIAVFFLKVKIYRR